MPAAHPVVVPHRIQCCARMTRGKARGSGRGDRGSVRASRGTARGARRRGRRPRPWACASASALQLCRVFAILYSEQQSLNAMHQKVLRIVFFQDKRITAEGHGHETNESPPPPSPEPSVLPHRQKMSNGASLRSEPADSTSHSTTADPSHKQVENP